MNVAIVKSAPGRVYHVSTKPQPDKEMLEAIENIKSTLRIQVRRGNKDAAFILSRLR